MVAAVRGGAHDDDVVGWALQEARLRGAPVVLARAHEDPPEVTTWAWYPVVDGAAFRHEAAEGLELQRAAAVRAYPDLHITTHLLLGPAVPALRALSERAQLLVIGPGSRGRGPRIGRTAAHLATHARCPVAVVRRPRPPATAAATVVAGVDGSSRSLAAADVAGDHAVQQGAGLVLLHALPLEPVLYGYGVEPPSPEDEALRTPVGRALQAHVEQVRSRCPGLHVECSVVQDDPAHALVEASRSAVLVVVGSRGLGAFCGLLLGSVSDGLVREAFGNVLVVHESRGADPSAEPAALSDPEAPVGRRTSGGPGRDRG
ncbi:universal stress protein [Cellulomonas endophytica]|uniref:universal stress protein n=1 Tax=Cellulomonas endophytica TaxID=2494735 RepID=UPI0013E98B18|nr:universal stress protein [Cellulomonas endophytica]